MKNFLEYLAARPYPGRGLLIGLDPKGETACAYFIMGRSENSRNRVFEATEDGIRTRARDEALMTDPSLIIYHPVREMQDGTLIVTNGDQTDTLRDTLAAGGTVCSALATREFEPDEPNFTPRVSGVLFPCGQSVLSILKTRDGKTCDRFYYSYEKRPGYGQFISTYEGFGDPLPSWYGEPLTVEIPEGLDVKAWAEEIWNALDENNRVSLWTRVGSDEYIINKPE